MKDYLVFGVRYCDFDTIFEWILDHQDGAGYIVSSVDTHMNKKYTDFVDEREYKSATHRYFIFYGTSITHNQELIFSKNTTNYTRTIIVLRNLHDVIDEILSCTFKNYEKVIYDQIDLTQGYLDAIQEKTDYLIGNYNLVINYDKWLMDVSYRDSIGIELGFENTDEEQYMVTKNYKLRNRLRYRKYITKRVNDINKKIDECSNLHC